VAVGAKGAKVGLLMFEVRHSAAAVAEALRLDDAAAAEATLVAQAQPAVLYPVEPQEAPVAALAVAPAPAVPEPDLPPPALHVVDSAAVSDDAALTPAYDPAYGGEVAAPASTWGPPKPFEQQRTNPAHWTAYDQTAYDQTAYDEASTDQASTDQPGQWS
jgi:hypothetical protein